MVSNFQASSSSWSFIFYTLHASQGCHNWITLNLRKWLATAALVVSRGGIVTSQVLISDGQQLEKNRCAVGALGLGDCMSSCHSSCETTKVSTNRIFGALQHPVKPSNAIRSSSYVSTYMIPNCHIVSHVSLCLHFWVSIRHADAWKGAVTTCGNCNGPFQRLFSANLETFSSLL